nr:MAG TPA: hypothetical protein [Caudoviricetes sp.]
MRPRPGRICGAALFMRTKGARPAARMLPPALTAAWKSWP